MTTTLIFALLLLASSIVYLGVQMSKNTDALVVITQAVTDAASAIRDLAAKAANGDDVSTQLTDLATKLETAVTDAGEPTGVTA